MTASPLRPLLALAVGLAAAAPAPAQAPAAIQLAIKDHVFIPAEVHLPANQPAWLEVTNQDPQPEEFESKPLGIEKVIPAGGKARFRVRPLKPGRYAFVGEYHEATTRGVVVVE